MYQPEDSVDLSFPGSSQSHILSEALPSSSSSKDNSRSDENDLSISELSLLTPRQPPPHAKFSLLAGRSRRLQEAAAPNQGKFGHDKLSVRDHIDSNDYEPADEQDEDQEYGEDGTNEEDGIPSPTPEERQMATREAARVREEKLESDKFMLQKLNASFAAWREALDESASVNQRLEERLDQTDRLLNKYISILSKQEAVAQLLFDEEWQGASADMEEIQRREQEARERRRKEAEEKALAAQREREARESAERQRLEQEERERTERNKKDKGRGTIRGVRGTRASMRGLRGTAPSSRGASSSRDISLSSGSKTC
jgi:hypothetical protein